MKKFLKDKNRQVIIFIAVALALSVFTYAAISVNNFNGGYSPPSVLNIRWGDYWTNSAMTTLNTSNAVTSYPRWTAEYKYRTMFIGMGRSGSSYNPPNTCTVWMYIVYSKKPVSDLFTFEYVPTGDRSSTSLNKNGYIRAYIPNDKYNVRDASQNPVSDVFIKCTSTTDFTNFMVSPIVASDLGDIGLYSGAYASGNNHYFEFDFYYECAGEHQQNAYPLTIDGLRSVADIPYAYILKCEEHAPPGGGATSGSSSDGGSSSGGSSGSGSGGNGKGDGGRNGWGNGEYGGGVDRDKINSQGDGGGYPDRDDMELSVPDDWKKPVDDNYNGGFNSEYKPDYPAYVPGEGDTGQNGENWELPSFDLNNDGVTGSINGYKELIPDGEYGLLELLPGISDWGYAELVPDGEYGLIDFMNPYGG